jgi:catechol 2,3-dioxygenase
MTDRTVQSVTLRVPQLESARRFYQEVVGFDVLEEKDGRVGLGSGGREVVTLVAVPDARPRGSGEAGLFHLAILFPERGALADALARVTEMDYVMTGASDHLVSEALYMNDPGANGVELYRDRPESEWEYDASGDVRMTTKRLNLEDLQGDGSQPTPDGAPEATRLGHVHLEVTDLERAATFYGDIFGMEMQTSRRGARFLSWDGYHHHVALNTWNRRRKPHNSEALGLESLTATMPASDVDEVRQRATDSGISVKETDRGFRLTDPDGIRWRIRAEK